MKRFAALFVFLVLLTGILPVSALNNGDVVGTIYNTDILAYVDGSPIRSYALDGKTAILVEDLARFGFVVGYDDASRSLYAYVKPNTFPHQPEENIERGTVGGTAGNIYFSDIKTYINGVLVPSFALNGVTAVAIEDIATDSTTENRSHTCMTYTWDGENRTISLNPVYDQSAKGGWIGYRIENDQIIYEENGRIPTSIFASVPDNAYAMPLFYFYDDYVAHVYQSYITVPDQNNSDTHQMRTYKRYIIQWDSIEEFVLAVEGNKSNVEFSHQELLDQEQKNLTNPKTLDFDNFTVLYDDQNILSISKETPCTVTDFCEILATDGMVDVITEYQKPDFEILNVAQNAENACFLLQTDTGLKMLNVRNGWGTISRFSETQSDIGTVYTVKSTVTPDMRSATVIIDDKPQPISHILFNGMWAYMPLNDLMNAVNGTVEADGLSVKLIVEGKHTYSFTNGDGVHYVDAYALSDNVYHPAFFVNEEKKPLSVQMTTGHFENTSTIDYALPFLYYDGKVYAPIQALDFFEYKEN